MPKHNQLTKKEQDFDVVYYNKYDPNPQVKRLRATDESEAMKKFERQNADTIDPSCSRTVSSKGGFSLLGLRSLSLWYKLSFLHRTALVVFLLCIVIAFVQIAINWLSSFF
jgi:hypothetical protein